MPLSWYKGGGGGGWLQPLPWVLALLQYLGNTLPLIDSLSCDLQDKVNIMGYGTARARDVIQKCLDHMLLMGSYLVTIATD